MRIEWPTLALLSACYATYGISTYWLAAVSPGLAVCICALAIALHSSLSHEAIHGHPTDRAWLNAALVFPALGLLVPYGRFRDTHLAHHHDARLTDPYDDPETNFICPADWARLPTAVRWLLQLNNTLAGRFVLGPVIGQVRFIVNDVRLVLAGQPGVLRSWLWHAVALGPVVLWLSQSAMSIASYGVAVYLAHAVLKLRTFLEHRAHDMTRARSVIIEDRGPLALLFLNNNLHAVHHMHPGVAWYDLPALYRAGRSRYLACNGEYRFDSYRDVIAQYLWRAKDPVPHPTGRAPWG